MTLPASKNQNRTRKKVGFGSFLVKRIRRYAGNTFQYTCSSSKYFPIYPPAFGLCPLHTIEMLLEFIPSTLEASEIEVKIFSSCVAGLTIITCLDLLSALFNIPHLGQPVP
ncbi:MAG TPA: hypothetical protein PLD48_09170 [Bacillota bacterium]|nr:hypothetical protein [Bacillota bacterium]HOK69679.1 hypothetical protein [Bacillota bacterium]